MLWGKTPQKNSWLQRDKGVYGCSLVLLDGGELLDCVLDVLKVEFKYKRTPLLEFISVSL